MKRIFLLSLFLLLSPSFLFAIEYRLYGRGPLGDGWTRDSLNPNVDQVKPSSLNSTVTSATAYYWLNYDTRKGSSDVYIPTFIIYHCHDNVSGDPVMAQTYISGNYFWPVFRGAVEGLQELAGADNSLCVDPCKDKKQERMDQCGDANIKDTGLTDAVGCPIYDCICPPSSLGFCDDSGIPGSGVESFDWDTCQTICPDCSDEYAALVERCGGAGNVAEVDDSGCGGRCKNCDDYWNEAAEKCFDYGGVKNAGCQVLSNGGVQEQRPIECNEGDIINDPDPDGESDPDEHEPDEIPDDTPDPDPDPSPDPEPEDPSPDPDNPNEGVLDAIKKNTDDIEGELNDIGNILDKNGNILSDIRRNDKIIGDNIVGELEDIGDKLDDLESPENIVADIGGVQVPEGNEYDGSLEGDEYTIEEDSLGEIIGEYVSGGMPVVASINETGITASGSCSVSGSSGPYTFDLSLCEYEDILRYAGYLLLSCAIIFAFFILVS